MNEKLNLIEILKDCPKGTKLYSLMWGEVEFEGINYDRPYPIVVKTKTKESNIEDFATFTSSGIWSSEYSGECMLFPSQEQRDWRKFKVKKPKFNPNTLKPFDKVLTRNNVGYIWCCHFFSHRIDNTSGYRYIQTDECAYVYCIPYNEDTKHLVGTSEEAPEFYRYWED